jgi:ElaB/YqjD/DUF883 family membrane-anchored ribosome-binding protein
MADRVTESTKSIEEDLAALRADLKALTASVAGLAKEKGDELRADIGARADQAAAAGRQATENVQDAVRERPITSVFAAFGVGILIGHLLDRR